MTGLVTLLMLTMVVAIVQNFWQKNVIKIVAWAKMLRWQSQQWEDDFWVREFEGAFQDPDTSYIISAVAVHFITWWTDGTVWSHLPGAWCTPTVHCRYYVHIVQADTLYHTTEKWNFAKLFHFLAAPIIYAYLWRMVNKKSLHIAAPSRHQRIK